MDCTIQGITDSVVAEDKKAVEKTVRQIRNMSTQERIELSNTPTAFMTRVFKAAGLEMDGTPIHILDIDRNEEGVFSLRYKVKGSPTVLETEIGELAEFAVPNSDFVFDSEGLTALYSDYDTINSFDDFEELSRDITNNPEKILETAQSLIDADDYHNDPDHNITLQRQLQSIVGTLVEMVPNLNVHINSGGSNQGKINVQTNDIYIMKGIGGEKSLMEIYVHELYHAVTHYAMTGTSTATRGITSRMEKIRDNFLSQTTETDLVRMSGDTISEIEASKLLDHLTDPKVGLHEFVALSMSNKAVMNQLKKLDVTERKEQGEKRLFYRLTDALHDLFQLVMRTITKEPEGDDFGRMVFLVSRLQHAHKKPLEAKRLFGIRNLISIFAPLENRFSEFIDKKTAEMKGRVDRNTQKEGEGDLRYATRLAARALYDADARGIITNTLSLATVAGMYNPFRPEGTIRSTARDMVDADQLQIDVEQLDAVSTVIDQQREYRAIYTSEVIRKAFTESLTKEQESALTDVLLDTDFATLFGKYDLDKLSNNAQIDVEIKQLMSRLNEISDKESVNFYDIQTTLLARYMNNHEDNIALLKNAENIAKKLGSPGGSVEASAELVSIIDDLASLKALRLVPKAKRQIVQDLHAAQTEGVEHFIAFQHGQKHKALKTLFPTPSDRINMIKGYSAQITNPDIEVTTAPLSEKAKLAAQGFKLVHTLTKHDMDRNATAMGMFINNRYVLQNFHRVGMRMTDKGRRGTSITESYSKSGDAHHTLRAANDIRNMKKRRDEVIRLMHEGRYEAEAKPSDNLISPAFNKVGQVTDFTYGMTKEDKIDLLEMERRATTIIGRTAASTYDKLATDKFNARLMELIEKDAKENLKEEQLSVIGKNQKEYIRITKDSPHAQVRDLWRILPSNIKHKYADGFTIRRDLMYFYLGYREMSITDLPGIKQFFGNNPNAYKTAIKHAVQFAEKLWQELVKISKIDIIIRTPGVFIGNVVSNFLLMYVSGYSFKEITALKLQGVKELRQFVDSTKESIMIEAKIEAGIATKEEVRRRDVLKNNLENSPVKDLVDEGFYTTILEEIEHGSAEDSGSYFNRLAKKKLANMPKIFSDGVDLLYITENTRLFKLIEKGVQASDFAARYAQYHLMIEEGTPKERAINVVRDNFINYNKPNSRFLEWANQMGFVMFTKYFTRIQRVIHRYGKEHPIKVLLSMLAQGYIFGDLDTFDDQSIITKDMGNLFYSPWDNMMRVFTPSSVEAVDWLLNGQR